jgi:hypothetical protein
LTFGRQLDAVAGGYKAKFLAQIAEDAAAAFFFRFSGVAAAAMLVLGYLLGATDRARGLMNGPFPGNESVKIGAMRGNRPSIQRCVLCV